MANEITVVSGISVVKDNLSFAHPTTSALWTMTGSGGPTPGYITVGIVEESTAFPELTTLGWLFMKNLDPTNYVRWGFSTTVYGGRMKPGETVGPFRLNPAATLFLIANTAACKVLVYAFED